MKKLFPLFFLFCFSAAVAQQQIYPNDILEGVYHYTDSAQEQRFKAVSEKHLELKRKEKALTDKLDSLQQVIKNEKDELLKARLDIILLLIKNEKANDVYEKMREFGDKAVLDINKRVAAPAWFYSLDKQYVQLIEERKNVGIIARNMSIDYNTANKIERAKKEERSKETPFDSLQRIMKVKFDEGNQKSFFDEVCKLYKQPVTTETVYATDYDIQRIITCAEVTEVFEKKTWTWGGVFCFYNGSAIPSELFYSESNASILKALNYHEQHKTGEK